MQVLSRTRVFAAAAAALVAVSASAAPALAGTRLAGISLKGQVTEVSQDFVLSFNPTKPNSLRDLTGRIEKAAKDGKIDGLLITMADPSLGQAQAEELRAALVAFKKSGKKVHLYSEAMDLRQYVIATAADEIVMMPSGGLEIFGMSVELMHMKGLLDKLGLEFDAVRAGKYKSAVEPMIQDKPSEATLEMMNALLDDMYAAAVKNIAEGRKLDAAQVKKLIDGGPYTAEKALAAKLVDKVESLETYKAGLKQAAGGNLTIVDNYGVKEQNLDIDFNNPFAMFKLFGELMGGKKDKPKDGSAKIALVYAVGAIQSGESGESLMGGQSLGSETFNKAIRSAREDKSVKAVVIRIDSPGGSALASEAMWREIVATAKEKPVIASMGDVAASGGYYIASAAQVILAEPNTITGSIGVFGGKMVMGGTYEKLGINVVQLKRGEHAGIYSSSTKFTESERKVIEEQIQEVYKTFLDRVAAGRNKDREEIHKIAQGRVWTGAAALKIGLVDELGGLDRALAVAADKAGLRDYKIEVLPKPKNFLDILLEGFGNTDARIAGAAVPAEIRALRAVLPDSLGRPLARMMAMLKVMEKERVLMAMPLVIEVK
jgi:protease-4